MSSPTWASSRDEFPVSVHALMSLWGGFANPTDYSDSGLEKRLELDFAAPVASTMFSVAELEEVLAAVHQELQRAFQADGLLAMEMTQSLLILTPNKMIVTSASEVMLHQLLKPTLALLASKSVEVEWASYLRRNTTSPWCAEGETSDIVAQEYADLKAAFPAGKSFLTGPVDSDHFIHFVYDDVERQASRTEEDVQVNVFLYDVVGGLHDAKQSEQHFTALPNGEYEVVRTFAATPCVSFETNAKAAVTSPARVRQLIDAFQPSRFTIVALQDKDTDGAALRRNFQAFTSYTLQNRTVNQFGEGYAFHQLLFARSD
ncbi:putative S-adenosylmethionine decarboxylase proenzyme- like [Leptomonas pyrrhocoris]|uniref:Putative S-adenosylmethionine decarboxylase proenzyme-like n=1 Tax=Leptomonas pyrrhocoris TaxID=157538 RepID=A0A0N0DXV8_LEPPY|nr:putative S-adenosylmethionine decarboxylase proenzyme- like [Leptomonas pyrrhocoris]KPA83435.1 putative S-adenosylmethionine decarboxylase proenzyme- like [Leptomonas pyrrhocoris]|eukprot:XP_015661874.1 putative S-adenosylmethionine decarboxylase proenzyme- like [Leptomonas pyrrhocoris]